MSSGCTHPHLLMLQKLKNDVPQILQVYLFLCILPRRRYRRRRRADPRQLYRRRRRRREYRVRRVRVLVPANRAPVPDTRVALALEERRRALHLPELLAEGLVECAGLRLALLGFFQLVLVAFEAVGEVCGLFLELGLPRNVSHTDGGASSGKGPLTSRSFTISLWRSNSESCS